MNLIVPTEKYHNISHIKTLYSLYFHFAKSKHTLETRNCILFNVFLFLILVYPKAPGVLAKVIPDLSLCTQMWQKS